jgi:hypothetical protein
MIAVKLILLIGVLFTIYIIYALCAFYFGDRVKRYIYDKLELKQAYKVLKEHQDKRALEFKKSLEPIEVEVEEVETTKQTRFAWNVENTKRLGENLVCTELIPIESD